MNYDEEVLIDRARYAYFKSDAPDQPEAGGSVREIGGVTYIALTNINGVLAVYQWDKSKLTRLKTWPPELDVM